MIFFSNNSEEKFTNDEFIPSTTDFNNYQEDFLKISSGDEFYFSEQMVLDEIEKQKDAFANISDSELVSMALGLLKENHNVKLNSSELLLEKIPSEIKKMNLEHFEKICEKMVKKEINE